MYGKHFLSMYEGSMLGAGPVVFAVWGYVIAKANSGTVELNPKLLATLIGTDVHEIEKAIDYLCQPDPDSRCKDRDGKRLEKIGSYAYSVTTHDMYRAMRNEEDRRAYNAAKQAEYRDKKSGGNVKCVPPCTAVYRRVPPCTAVYRDVPPCTHTEAEAEAEANTEANTNTNTYAALGGESVSIGKKTRKQATKPEEVDDQVWSDWLAVRRAKRLAVTATALEGIRSEAMKAKMTLPEAIKMAAEEGWGGFKAEWVETRRQAANPATKYRRKTPTFEEMGL